MNMKDFKKSLSRLGKSLAPRKGKKGASLAFVMAIGAALVIWVTCIMPLMATTGTVAYQTQGKQATYLGSRSAIEFCKSELENIVKTSVPYTFAVKELNNGTFEAIPKYTNTSGQVSVSGTYSGLINIHAGTADATDDRKDVPTSNDVVAICAVVESIGGDYKIDITTWNNCEKGLTYSVTFTPDGNLLIFPEAYGDKQALPLSDFVLVDGQLGNTTVWNSTITVGNSTTRNFTETLMPWILPSSDEYSTNYANARGYPSAFKTTAEPATYNDVPYVGNPIPDLRTSDEWSEPYGVEKENQNGGSIWYTVANGKVRVYLYTHSTQEITDQCQVYFNGKHYPDKSVPTTSGVYQVTIDYTGTGSTFVKGKVNILPAKGIVMPKLYKVAAATTGKHQLTDEEKKIKVSAVDPEWIKDSSGKNTNQYNTVKVTLSGSSDGLLYGCVYIDSDGKSVVQWSPDNFFTGLDKNTSYFFYVCRPASIENGQFIESSDVECIGRIFPNKGVAKMTEGNFLIMTNDSNANTLKYDLNVTKTNSYVDDGYIVANVANNDDTFFTDYTWKVIGSDLGWNFINKQSQYLDLYAEPYTIWGVVVGYHNYKAQLTSTSILLNVSHNGENATVSRYLDGGSIFGYDIDTTVYLDLSKSSKGNEKSATVKLVQIPSYPETPKLDISYELKDYTMTTGNSVFQHVATNLNPADTLNSIFVNTTKYTYSDNSNLLPGIYQVAVSTDTISDTLPKNLVINKAAQTAASTVITVTPVDSTKLTDQYERMYADMMVKVTASNLDTMYGNLYIGYRLASEAETEYRWFPADSSNSHTFCLEYGDYIFAAKYTGDSVYTSSIFPAEDAVRENREAYIYTISPQPITLDQSDAVKFEYTNSNGSGVVVWYKLPDNVNPSRVKLVYGVPTSDDGKSIRWQATQTSDCVWYGVVVLNSNYGGPDFSDLSHALKLPSPIAITNANGHQSSIIRGSSMYFMGGRSNKPSIDTWGNDIFLTSDIVVLSSEIVHSAGEDGQKTGRVIVEPYTPNDGTNYTLLYNPTDRVIIVGTANLAPDTFYKVDAGKDLCTLTDAYLSRNGRTLGTTRSAAVTHQFTLSMGAFPEINLDIAYANETQLSYIISSETVGWTDKGKLRNTSTLSNYAKYAVCTFVHEITSSAHQDDYKANRILIAAETTTGYKDMIVPYSVSFTVRYLSIDAEHVTQQNSSYFKVHNLGEDESFIEQILNLLKLNSFSSKSLQVDFERFTIITPGAMDGIAKQIYRYESGTDLFTGASKYEKLLTDYSLTEIKNMFGVATTGAYIVDRYISITPVDGEGSTLNVSTALSSRLSIYANYIHIDDKLKEIKFESYIWGGSNQDIVISSQEGGYGDNEYLAFFRNNSSEKYKGTLVYLEGPLKVTFADSFLGFDTNKSEFNLGKGFYYIYATTDGTSITRLTNLFTGTNLNDNTEKKPYKIAEESLKDYAVYVDKDGNLTNAYVDTGLEGSGGIGGFSGGKVE